MIIHPLNMSNPPQIPNKHHFIPQFWIKNWAGTDGKVQRFRNPYKRIVSSQRKFPAAVGWFKGLYDISTHGKKTLDFETLLFRKIDQSASNLFNRLKATPLPALRKSDTVSLGIFITSLLHRSPAGLEAMNKLAEKMERDIRADLRPKYSKIRGPNDPPDVESYEALLGPNAHKDHMAGMFHTVLGNENVVNAFINLFWRRIDLPPEAPNLLLSDDPLIRTNGLLYHDGHVAFPLTPRSAVIGVYDEQYFHELFSQPLVKLAKLMNLQAVESAREFVVDQDERQLRFISNRFGSKPRPTLSEASLRDYTPDRVNSP